MSLSEQDLVRVTVKAEPGTEVFLIDHAFQLRAKGVSHLSQPVEPGLYQVKFRAGRLIEEVHQAVRPGSGEVVVHSPALRFPSAVPLADTSRTHEYHEEAAQRLSGQVHRQLGKGSQLFVFSRRWSAEPAPPTGHPARQLSLHHADGSVLVSYEADAEADLTVPDPWAGFTAEIDPGVYRLRVVTSRWGAIERTVVASPGWQTQVFMLQSNYGDSAAPELRADLASAAMLMSLTGRGVLTLEAARRVELARMALLAGRAVVTGDQLLAEAVDNPMLGILGASALLLANEPDHTTVAAVLAKLSVVLGPHPDVDALCLAIGADPHSLARTFEHPPLLMGSWGPVVTASWQRPDLVPEGSLAARIATSLWGYGPWLLWLADEADDQPAGGASPPLDDALARLSGLARGVERQAELTDVEAALLSHVGRSSPQPVPSFDIDPTGGDAAARPAPNPYDDLARAMGLPPATLRALAHRLADKLERSV